MADNYTITSPEPPIHPAEYVTLPEYLLAKAKEWADKGKYHYAVDSTTKEKRYFNKFDIESAKIASALHKCGLRKGDVVIYMPSEMTKLHIFMTGVWRANGICRATYIDEDAATIEFRIKETRSRHILCDSNRLEVCSEATKNINWPVQIITTDKTEGHLSLEEILEIEDGTSCPILDIGGEDIALMLCTSGTTGPPKASVLTHVALVGHAHFMSFYPFTENKPNIVLSAATHYTAAVFPLAILVSGKTCIFLGKITKELLLKTVDEMKPGLVFAFPTYLLCLIGPEAKGYDLSSLELLFTGGAIVTPAIKKALLELPNVKDLVIAYGLSEAGVLITNAIMRSDRDTETYTDTKDFSVGRPQPGTSVQIRHSETLELLGPFEKGEICLHNNTLFHSYFNDPEATKNAYIENYLRTGDAGYYDEQGFIYVVDRLKEMFTYYRNHISPSEIENVIGQHPNVDEVCVVGTPETGGDVPRAFVILKGNPSSNIAEEIKEFAHSKLANYKHLRGGLYIVPELPKGKSGKVMRSLVGNIQV